MARILKPSVKGVIIDSVLPLAESMILDLIRELAPAHSQMSAYTERLDRLFDENMFIVTNRRQHKEIMYLVMQK